MPETTDSPDVAYHRAELHRALHTVPSHMHHAIEAWVLFGLKPGSFLTAVLSNDLMEAFGRADHMNAAAMQAWVRLLYNNVPSACKGSPEVVSEWHEQGGIVGRESVPA